MELIVLLYMSLAKRVLRNALSFFCRKAINVCRYKNGSIF